MLTGYHGCIWCDTGYNWTLQHCINALGPNRSIYFSNVLQRRFTLYRNQRIGPKWIPDKCFPSIHLKIFMSDVMIIYIILSRFTNLSKIYLVGDSWWCSNIHVLLDKNNYWIQIYIISKNWSVSFITSTLLLSHISVAIRSTSVQFDPHWPCLVHFGLFSPFRYTYKSIWLK